MIREKPLLNCPIWIEIGMQWQSILCENIEKSIVSRSSSIWKCSQLRNNPDSSKEQQSPGQCSWSRLKQNLNMKMSLILKLLWNNALNYAIKHPLQNAINFYYNSSPPGKFFSWQNGMCLFIRLQRCYFFFFN